MNFNKIILKFKFINGKITPNRAIFFGFKSN